MKIDKLIHEHIAELRLRGEFDTFYCPKLQEEVDQLIQAGHLYTILNLRLVKFINSTAIGAILKANKRFRAEGGDLVIGNPSPFCREVLSKLGIDKLVPMFTEIEEAQDYLHSKMEKQDLPEVIGESNVLFTFPDPERSQRMGPRKTGLGTVLSVDHERIRFSWNGGIRKMGRSEMRELFPDGSNVHVKFQVKLCKKGFFEVDTAIEKCEVSEEEGAPEASVTGKFLNLPESDKYALAQFADDLDFLKNQLREISE